MKPQIFGIPSYMIMWVLMALVSVPVGTWLGWRGGFSARRSLVACVAAGVIIFLGSKLPYLAEQAFLHPAGTFVFQRDDSSGVLGNGFRIPGGVFLMIPLFPLICRSLRLPALEFADATFPAIAIALVLNRVGCFMMGCCFGRVTSFPLAITFPPGATAYQWQLSAGLLTAGAPRSLPVHPLQLYFVALWALLYFLARHWQRTKHFDGQVWTNFNLVFFGGTFLVEFLRPYWLHVNLILCATVVVATAWLRLLRALRPAPVMARSAM